MFEVLIKCLSVSLVEAAQNSELSIAGQAVVMVGVRAKSNQSEANGGCRVRGDSLVGSVKSTEGGKTAVDRSAKNTGSKTNERSYSVSVQC